MELILWLLSFISSKPCRICFNVVILRERSDAQKSGCCIIILLNLDMREILFNN